MSAAFHADPAPSAELSAELSPPQPDGRNGWYVHPVRVGIISSSELSAGSRIEYRLNEGSWAVYTSPFMVDSDGINTLEYRSTDGNGIAGTVQSVTVKLDSAAPVTSASAGPADGKNGWYRSAPVVSLTAADAVSSVARTVYRLNDGPWSEYSQPVTVSVYGSDRLEYRSIDQAGNEEQARSLTLNVDSAAPALRLALDKTTLWPPNNKTVSVTASVYASDSGSGIASVVLTSITSNEPLQPDDIQDAQYGTADTSFRLRASRAGSGNGRIYTITYTATDQAGNQITASANVRVPHDPSGR
ncbi:hypothetical protein LJK88_17495 [Paenibacillus sp. P26]|nr:hypothetical protein LJK88_17495 [Paenibacillus sp. P26]